MKNSNSSHPSRSKTSRRILILFLVLVSTVSLSFQNLAGMSIQNMTGTNHAISIEKLADSSQTAVVSLDAKAVTKDETVYFTLKPDGGVDKISVVNFMQTPTAGDYIDYGPYKEVKSLSLDLTPKVDGNKITWSLPASDQGFYYQGTLENINPPFLFKIDYLLDGKSLPISELVGKSGKVEINIHVDPNPDTAAYFK